MESKLITLAKEHKMKIDALHDKRAKNKDKFQDEKYKINEEFYAAERKAKDIEYKKLKVIEDIEADMIKECKEQIDFLYYPINALDRILNFKDIEKKSFSTNFYVYYFDYPKDSEGKSDCGKDKVKYQYSAIDTIKATSNIVCNAYITDNRKPINKYNLIIAGKSRFNEDIIKLPYHYSIDAHIDNANIAVYVNSFPTKKFAEDFYERNRRKLLKDSFKEHEKAELEYEKVKNECTDKIWEIALLEKKKYYYEHNYHNGTEEKEYKEICQQLEELK